MDSYAGGENISPVKLRRGNWFTNNGIQAPFSNGEGLI
jgi:hypothetical protein